MVLLITSSHAFTEPVCGDPQIGTENVVPGEDLWDRFEGGRVTFECESGFIHESGDFNRDCVYSDNNLIWSGSPMICQPGELILPTRILQVINYT